MKHVILISFILHLLFSNLALIRADNNDWWKNSIIYQVFIWSFKDSDGDGIGDLKGVTSKLDHFTNLHVDVILLSPFFKSAMDDMGYDVENYLEIEPKLGTMADFEELMDEAKQREIKVIIDFVINHSSIEHPWFKKSVKKTSPYSDYYIWKNGAYSSNSYSSEPPNNWQSIFGGSAWEYHTERKQYYLHQFGKNQPDLNLRNDNVKKEIKNILRFWFDKGVAGVRLDATKHYIEDINFQDEPLTDSSKKVAKSYEDLDHIYTVNQQESYKFIHEIRTWVDDYSKEKDDFPRILIAEAYTNLQHTMDYYGNQTYRVTHFPFNFQLVTLNSYLNAKDFDRRLNTWLKAMPPGATPNWMTENHDNIRVGTRLCPEYMDILTTIIMILPGIACPYYGSEIGMTNGIVREDQRKDMHFDVVTGTTRDCQRLPMQWENTTNGGFTENHQSWLPVNPNYDEVNVADQMNDSKHSRYKMFKTLSKKRKTNTLKRGSFQSYPITEWVIALVRSYKDDNYITVANLGTELEAIYLKDIKETQNRGLEVVTASMNAGYQEGDQIHGMKRFRDIILMAPLSAMVLKTTPYNVFPKCDE